MQGQIGFQGCSSKLHFTFFSRPRWFVKRSVHRLPCCNTLLESFYDLLLSILSFHIPAAIVIYSTTVFDDSGISLFRLHHCHDQTTAWKARASGTRLSGGMCTSEFSRTVMDETCTAGKKYGKETAKGDPTRGQDSIGGRAEGPGEREGNVIAN